MGPGGGPGHCWKAPIPGSLRLVQAPSPVGVFKDDDGDDDDGSNGLNHINLLTFDSCLCT